eukprot:jgi/Astpho2/4099/Aster-x1201
MLAKAAGGDADGAAAGEGAGASADDEAGSSSAPISPALGPFLAAPAGAAGTLLLANSLGAGRSLGPSRSARGLGASLALAFQRGASDAALVLPPAVRPLALLSLDARSAAEDKQDDLGTTGSLGPVASQKLSYEGPFGVVLTRLKYDAASDTVTVETLSILAQKQRTQFTPKHAAYPETFRPQSTFALNGKVFYIDPITFPDQTLLERLTPPDPAAPTQPPEAGKDVTT